ncbi:hypothetical protein CHISP_0761 [Chitinispirillum alkaliphilum]|nr:hypothetical protein CHISP_0761 [Chitinispirillum alkaliphilum]
MENRDYFEDIVAILRQEKEIHHSLINSAESINASIRNGNQQELSSFTTVYDEQICRLEKMEERRIEIYSGLCQDYNIAHSAKLSSVLHHAPEKTRGALEEASSQLKELITKLSAVNESNKILLEESLNALNYTFDTVKQSSQRFKGYRHKGDQKTSNSEITIFNQVI